VSFEILGVRLVVTELWLGTAVLAVTAGLAPGNRKVRRMATKDEANMDEIGPLDLGKCPQCGGDGQFEMDCRERIGRCDPCKVRWSAGEDPLILWASCHDDYLEPGPTLLSDGFAWVDVFSGRADAEAALWECKAKYCEAYEKAKMAKAEFRKIQDSVSLSYGAARAYLAPRGHFLESRPRWMKDDLDDAFLEILMRPDCADEGAK
jgi:hypothetical protein